MLDWWPLPWVRRRRRRQLKQEHPPQEHHSSNKQQQQQQPDSDPFRSSARVLLDANRESAVVLCYFHSRSCRLCRSLRPDVNAWAGADDGLIVAVVEADVDDERWMPEMLHYNIEYVPCAVLLESASLSALARTPPPRHRPHALRSLDALKDVIARDHTGTGIVPQQQA